MADRTMKNENCKMHIAKLFGFSSILNFSIFTLHFALKLI